MRSDIFYYSLPQELIAQEPLLERDCSRLLVLDRVHNSYTERAFKDILDFFEPGDCLVLNDTRVLPARIYGEKETGARIEFLFLRQLKDSTWEVLVKPAKRLKENTRIFFGSGAYTATVCGKTAQGTWLVSFYPPDVKKLMQMHGLMPTPPYIKKELQQQERYQTVYAVHEGAIAAPTAGLHFTSRLLKECRLRKVRIAYITLHVGLGTFRPINAEQIEEHRMDEEWYRIPQAAAGAINRAKDEDKRIFAVGTTATRALESASDDNGKVTAGEGTAELFITPSYRFKTVDCLLTNFHLPDSTNLVLVASFAGLQFIKEAYSFAVEARFRFYSFGDAMLIV